MCKRLQYFLGTAASEWRLTVQAGWRAEVLFLGSVAVDLCHFWQLFHKQMLLATITESLVGTFNLAFLGFPPQCVRFRASLARDGQVGTYWQQSFMHLA